VEPELIHARKGRMVVQPTRPASPGTLPVEGREGSQGLRSGLSERRKRFSPPPPRRGRWFGEAEPEGVKSIAGNVAHG
jgi:hypothetical protein